MRRSLRGAMRVHRPFAIFGSRLLYCALAPWLVVCVPLFPYMAWNFARGPAQVVLAGLVSLVCVVGLFVATDSWRFIRWNIALLALVPVVYVWYFVQMYFVEGQALAPSARVSTPSPWSALLGLVVWGVPSLLGVAKLRAKARRIDAVTPRWRERNARWRAERLRRD